MMKRAVTRDNILKHKMDLKKTEGIKEIYIDVDKPLEVRKSKSFLRKKMYAARLDGAEVAFRHNKAKIKFNDEWYSIEELDKLPQKYLPPD